MAISKPTKNVITNCILAVCMFFIAYSLYQLYIENSEVHDRSVRLDSINRANKLSIDSLVITLKSLKKQTKDSAVYSRGGKPITIAQIIKSSNQWYMEKEQLKVDLETEKSMVATYKFALDSLLKVLNRNASRNAETIRKLQENSEKVNKTYPPSKFWDYQTFHQLVNSRYDLTYKLEKGDSTSNSSLFSLKGTQKLDSALWIFKLYNDGVVLKKGKNPK